MNIQNIYRTFIPARPFKKVLKEAKEVKNHSTEAMLITK